MTTRRLSGSILLLLLAGGLPACGPKDCDPEKDQDYCESGVAHRCIDKGPTKEWSDTTCTNSPAPACVTATRTGDVRTIAFCAINAEPDARCPPDPAEGPNASFCASAKIYECIAGHVILARDCAPGSQGCC